jgi:hypothetical protein
MVTRTECFGVFFKQAIHKKYMYVVTGLAVFKWYVERLLKYLQKSSKQNKFLVKSFKIT